MPGTASLLAAPQIDPRGPDESTNVEGLDAIDKFASAQRKSSYPCNLPVHDGRDRHTMTSIRNTVSAANDARTTSAFIRPSLDQDRAAELFRQVVVPHLADGLALARWLVGSTSDAEDVVQDACMRALKAIGTYRGGSPRAWLLTIVRNTAFSWLAKQRSSTLVMVGDLADIDVVSAAAQPADGDPQPTPESELIRRADEQTINAAIAALSLPMREVLVLRDVNGFSYKEIAEMLNLPIGTVMSRLARGRQQLAALVVRAER